MRPRIFLSAFLAFALYFASSFPVAGTVYDSQLEPVRQVIIQAYSLPSFSLKAQVTAQNGSYAFDLPEGNYSINARRYLNSTNAIETSENVSVSSPVSLDLIFLDFDNFQTPSAELPVELQETPPISPQDLVAVAEPEKLEYATAIAIAAAALLASIAGYFVWARYLRKTKTQGQPQGQLAAGEGSLRAIGKKEGQKTVENAPAQKTLLAAKERETLKLEGVPKEQPESLSRDEKELLQVIKKLGGRVAQKEIRKNVDWSEAQVSMVLSDLEDKGAVRKIKKGRGNIIRLETG